MKPHYKMTFILFLYFIFLLFTHHPEYYSPIVQFMNEWDWFLSGLSAGAFAVFFSRRISREKELQHKKSLATLALIELHANCKEMIHCIDCIGFTYNPNFTKRSLWDEAKLPLTHYLKAEDFTAIEAAYREMKLLENIIKETEKHSINEIFDIIKQTIPYARKAFDILQKASGTTELTFPKSDFETFN